MYIDIIEIIDETNTDTDNTNTDNINTDNTNTDTDNTNTDNTDNTIVHNYKNIEIYCYLNFTINIDYVGLGVIIEGGDRFISEGESIVLDALFWDGLDEGS